MSGSRLALLGGFELRAGAKLTSRKGRALLAYLALHPGKPQSRDRLASLLWEESPESQARTSLRQALAAIRRALPAAELDLLQTTPEAATVAPGRLAVDALEFEDRLRDPSPEAREEAVAIYRGDFLNGFSPRAPAFEDWMRGERERLREKALTAMEELVNVHAATGDLDRAVNVAARLLGIDPLREDVHRTLMGLYARQGRRANALKQFRICRDVLDRELGIGPEPETQALCDNIERQRRAPGSPSPAPSPTAPPETAGQTWPAGEVRQAVVMGTVVAFESADLEPEELDALQKRTAALVDRVVQEHGGLVLSHLGESSLAIFGVPTAGGDEPERAVHAGLALLEATDDADESVFMQVGVAGGPVIPSETERERSVTGKAVNLARRMALLAGPGELRVAASIRQSLAGRLDTDAESGEGESRSWMVLGLRDEESHGIGFVGRTLELAQLEALLGIVRSRTASLTVVLQGEAGIGKTRLLHRLAQLAAATGWRRYGAAVRPFGPQKERILPALTQSLLRVTDADRLSEGVRRAVEEALVDPDQEVFLNELLDLKTPPKDAGPADFTARLQAQLEVVVRLIASRAEEAPLLVEIDDLHWAAPSELELLARIAGEVQDLPLLLLVTCRADARPLDAAWRATAAAGSVTTLELGPLDPESARAMAQQYAGEPERVSECVARAAGNPLFLDQLLRNLEHDADRLPDSLHSVVLARLDGLPSEDRRTLQAIATLGSPVDEAAIRHLLDEQPFEPERLLKMALLVRDGGDLGFVHAVLAESVKRAMPRSRRRALHLRAAEWYRQRSPTLWAEHLDAAADPSAAAAYLSAARWELDNLHFERSLTLVERGLLLTSQSPESPDRQGVDRLPGDLHVLSGDVLTRLGRLSSALPAYEQALPFCVDDRQRAQIHLRRAITLRTLEDYESTAAAIAEATPLAEAVGCRETQAHLESLRGSIAFAQSDLPTCIAAQETSLQIAREAGLPLAEARALGGLGDARYHQGRMQDALEGYDACIQVCRRHGFRFVEAAHLSMAGLCRFYLNHGAEGQQCGHDAAQMAAEVGHLRAEMVAFNVLATIETRLGNFTEALTAAARSSDIAHRLGSRYFEADNLGQRANALIESGRSAEALPLLRRAVDQMGEHTLGFVGAWILGLMARATDDPSERSRAIAQGQELLTDTTVSHNHLHFHENVLEGALARKDWAEARTVTDTLHRYLASAPNPWAEIVVARARALLPGDDDEAVDAASVRDRAAAAGLRPLLPLLDEKKTGAES